MTEIKKCADCKFWIPGDHEDRDRQLDYARCSHPKITDMGKIKTYRAHMGKADVHEYMYCEIARRYDNECGKEAKHFEPK